MAFSLLALFSPRRTEIPVAPRPVFFRPQLEGYEDRIVPAPLGGNVGQVGPINISPHFNLNFIDINISNIRILNNQLVGDININGVPVTGTGPGGSTVITPTLIPASGDEPCPVLNLELGAIHLDLLGLNVDTSDICVRVAGEPGEGNLLGNLICGLTGALDGSITNLNSLQGGLGQLTGILNGVFDRITNQAALAGVSGTGDSSNGSCDILNLSVGPLDLNLLGLDVEADNCAGGPITVDITAEPGPGNLLGNLLCDLSELLDRPGNRFGQIQQLLGQITDAIGDILAANRP